MCSSLSDSCRWSESASLRMMVKNHPWDIMCVCVSVWTVCTLCVCVTRLWEMCKCVSFPSRSTVFLSLSAKTRTVWRQGNANSNLPSSTVQCPVLFDILLLDSGCVLSMRLTPRKVWWTVIDVYWCRFIQKSNKNGTTQLQKAQGDVFSFINSADQQSEF